MWHTQQLIYAHEGTFIPEILKMCLVLHLKLPLYLCSTSLLVASPPPLMLLLLQHYFAGFKYIQLLFVTRISVSCNNKNNKNMLVSVIWLNYYSNCLLPHHITVYADGYCYYYKSHLH